MTEKSFDIFKLKFYTKFPDSLFTFENIENSNSEYILVNNIYGINKCRKSHLLDGVIPTIMTAVDKNLYFINKMIAVHSNKYDYSLLKYKTLLDKVKIICKDHGLFEQTAGAHSMGQGCPKCGDKICSDHHSSNPTGWSKTNWKDAAKNKPKMSELTKLKIGIAHKGKVITQEHKDALGKKVIDVQTGIIYSSCTEAAKFLNIPKGTLNSRLIGKCKNYTSFKYL